MKISLLKAILRGISCIDTQLDEEAEILYLLTDSRQLGADAEHTLFFAIKTAKDDGSRYIPQLKERGVRAFVTENAIEALQAIAVYKRNQYHGPVIGITGSNGKTVVKEWLYQLLKDDFVITRSPQSYNSQIGVPLSLWQLTDKTQLAIFEAGISQPGEMERLEKMIRPTLGVITYIGEEHGENFTSLQQKREEKMLLFRHCPILVEDSTHQNVRTCAAVLRALGYKEEVIAERLLQQTHETVLQINLSALIANTRYFRSLLRPSTRLTCMVKAFAYGAGSVEVSRALQKAQLADYLAVAVADEGIELRRAGITLPIIVMDPEIAALDRIIENNLEPNIYSFYILQAFSEAAQRQGMENYPVHIKIDTGMHRLGFDSDQLESLASMLSCQRTLRVQSVFSHLAAADEDQWDHFTNEQVAVFQRASDYLQHALGYPFLRHILNSAGMERFTADQMDMCRLGIGMYGFSFVNHPMRNVCTLKATILSIKTVSAGETIGYGRHTTLSEPRQIAVIPIGYADGFDRRFSNYGGEVFVRGKLCPVVGNVCMDQAMIDVTGTDAQVGDYVEIFGDHLALQSLADRLQTIPYEVLTSVSRRVQRQYFYE